MRVIKLRVLITTGPFPCKLVYLYLFELLILEGIIGLFITSKVVIIKNFYSNMPVHWDVNLYTQVHWDVGLHKQVKLVAFPFALFPLYNFF